MKRWFPPPILTPTLALIWLLLSNSFSPGQILLGLLLGGCIPRFTLAFWPDRVKIRHPMRLLRFFTVFLYEVLIANFSVARLILAGPRALRPAFIIVPLDLENDLAISLLANTICLTPGTVSAKLSDDRKCLLIHALDAEDLEAVIATIKERFEKPLKEIFE